MIHGFTNLDKLSPQAQNNKLEVYNIAIKNTVDDFLAHFSGAGTFQLRTEVVMQLEAPTTALQHSMSKIDVQFKGYSGTGWRMIQTMGKLQDQEYVDVAEYALSFLDKLKCLVEVRAAVL